MKSAKFVLDGIAGTVWANGMVRFGCMTCDRTCKFSSELRAKVDEAWASIQQ